MLELVSLGSGTEFLNLLTRELSVSEVTLRYINSDESGL
jgi:hypothetical protein